MEIVKRKTSDLIPYINNSRTHDEEQILQITASIKEFGFTNPILIDPENGVIAGHCRLMASKKLSMEEVPCIVLDNLTETQRKAYVIADNSLAINAGWNDELLKLEIENLKELDFDIDLLGFDDEDLNDIFEAGTETSEGLTDPDDAPEIQETTVSIQGDVWIMGNHRLMCGDSTDEEKVIKLLDNNQIDMIFSDPPYGVSYSDKNEFLKACTGGKGNHVQKPIINDHYSPEETGELWKSVFNIWSEFLSDYSSYYISSPQGGELFMMMMMMNENGFPVRHINVWNKNNLVLSRCDYNYKHEPILYGWKNKHKFYGKGDHKTSVWDIDRPHKSKLHPTMKPIELIENCLRNSTLKGHKVADMFGGSGSTLIACEKTDRHCLMMEIDEHYCDVIVRRWQEYTGQNAIHETTGKTFEQTQEERV